MAGQYHPSFTAKQCSSGPTRRTCDGVADGIQDIQGGAILGPSWGPGLVRNGEVHAGHHEFTGLPGHTKEPGHCDTGWHWWSRSSRYVQIMIFEWSWSLLHVIYVINMLLLGQQHKWSPDVKVFAALANLQTGPVYNSVYNSLKSWCSVVFHLPSSLHLSAHPLGESQVDAFVRGQLHALPDFPSAGLGLGTQPTPWTCWRK